ncbi:MAG: response regulator [Flavobacterium sp.]|nr:MAG: response regulator [Flavobacterium sp.]
MDKAFLYYVDDDGDDLSIFEAAADDLGCEVELFNRGDELLSSLGKSETIPSVVYVDLNMPGMSGYEVISKIRESDALQDVPVVVLSTASDKQSIEKSRNAGASYYVQKPTSFGKLKAAISHTLGLDWKNLGEFVFLD